MLRRMRGARGLLFASVAAIVAVAGCSLGRNGIGGGGTPEQDALPAGDDETPDASGGGGDGGDSGNGVDGGERDGGAGEGGGDAGGNPSLCGGGFLFCDGFESGIDASTWQVGTTMEGHVAVDSTYVYRGAKALHASLDAFQGGLAYGPSAQLLHHDMSWPGHIFVRAFVYAPQPLPANFTTLFTVGQYGGNPVGLQLNVAPGAAEAWAETIFADGQNDGTWLDSTTMASAQWACVEIEVDSGAGKVKVSVNGTVLAMLNHPIGMVMPALQQLAIGLYIFNPPASQGATEIWVDEVAVDGSAIGCSK